MKRLALPLLALVLVAAVLGIQLAHGGGSYTPLQLADPCSARPDAASSTGLDALTERLVLLGLDDAACRLHTSREALVLRLGGGAPPSTAEVEAVRAGLLQAVARLDAEGSLPPASTLVDQALDDADLNGFLKAAIRAIPDSVIDSALKTDDVLTRTVDDLDLRTLLTHLDDQQDLEHQLESAVSRAVVQSLVARVRGLL